MRPVDSLTTTTSLPMRRPTSRQVSTVSLEVAGARTISRSLLLGAAWKQRIPTHFSGQNVTAAISAMESDDVLLAKIAPGFANLSSSVNISILISISSGTASITRSASRQASSTDRADESSASVPSFCCGVTSPRATPSSSDRRIHSSACSRTGEDTSSTIVRKPPSAAAQAMPRPIAPAPITAIVFTSTDSPWERSWRHRPSTAGHDRRTGLFHRRSPHLIADFEQTFARAPRLLLSLRPRGELRQDRASRLMMLVFVRINYVVVEAGGVFLSHPLPKFQKLDGFPAPPGPASDQPRRNAPDGRVQPPAEGE